MFGATDLYLEISPQNLIDGRTLNLPSDGIAGYVCKEIHPGIYCSPATGQAHFLRVSPAWVDVQLKAENAELREQGTRKGVGSLCHEPFPGAWRPIFLPLPIQPSRTVNSFG
jgi:hypothetical protein